MFFIQPITTTAKAAVREPGCQQCTGSSGRVQAHIPELQPETLTMASGRDAVDEPSGCVDDILPVSPAIHTAFAVTWVVPEDEEAEMTRLARLAERTWLTIAFTVWRPSALVSGQRRTKIASASCCACQRAPPISHGSIAQPRPLFFFAN